MAITPDFLKKVIDYAETQRRIRLISDINSDYIKSRVDNSKESYSRSDAVIDAELIAEVMIAQHGLSLDRFANLNQVQRDYICTLVSSILERFCVQLEKMTHFVRVDS